MGSTFFGEGETSRIMTMSSVLKRELQNKEEERRLEEEKRELVRKF